MVELSRYHWVEIKISFRSGSLIPWDLNSDEPLLRHGQTSLGRLNAEKDPNSD